MEAAGASIASGVLDAISSGVLIYTATVELIAHEFIFNKSVSPSLSPELEKKSPDLSKISLSLFLTCRHYHNCSWGKLLFSLTCFALGAGIMALLGKWA